MIYGFSVFAFSALPQALKTMAVRGIPLTQMWGMAYLLSFLMLEGLDLFTPRNERDNASSKYCETFSNSSLVLFLGRVAIVSQIVFLWELSGIFPESVFRNE